MPPKPPRKMARANEPSLDGIVAAPLLGRNLGPPGADFVLAESTDPGGPPGPPRPIAPLHMHHREDEAWYVLEGTLKITLGNREVEATTGSAVFGPRGVPHTFWNPGPGPARYLLIMGPDTSRLIAELHSMTNRDREAVAAVFRKYNCEILG